MLIIILILIAILNAATDTITHVSVDTWGTGSSGKIAYMDYTYITSTIFYSSINIVDIKTKAKTTIIPDDGTYPYYISYGFYGNNIVYIPYKTSGSGGGSGGGSYQGGSTSYLYLKQIDTGAKRQLTSSTAWKSMVHTYGNIVTWIDYRYIDTSTIDSLNSEVYYYDLTDNTEYRVTNNHSYQCRPYTNGERIVWIDYTDTYGRLFMYTISTQTATEIAQYNAGKEYPRINGDYVVWEDYRKCMTDPNDVDIYAYNIITKEVKPICEVSGFQGRPYIYGNFIAWEDYRNAINNDTGNCDIYGYDLLAGREIPLVVKDGYQAHPTIFDDTLCWLNNQNGTMKLITKPITDNLPTDRKTTNTRTMALTTYCNNNALTIFNLPANQPCNIQLYSISGTKITKTNSYSNSNGSLTLDLDTKSSSGIFIARISTANTVYFQKVVVW